jgi:hypothetical protein
VANIVLAGNANWTTCNGGNPPGATDNIYLNGHGLNLNGAGPFTCALIAAVAANGTTPTLGDITFTDGATINANLQAGTSPAMILLGGSSLTVNGNVTGGTAVGAICIDVGSGA